MDKVRKTKEIYSFLWKRERSPLAIDQWHFNKMQERIPESIVRGQIGIDIGSGCGYDTYIMAKAHPLVNILSMDISDGIFRAKEIVHGLKNTFMIKGSVLDIPIKDNILDFAYSYGVLHHTPDPGHGVRELARILKRNAPLFLYLYEDHSENHIKYYTLKIIRIFRKITARIHPRILYIISFLSSPFTVILFTYPAKILNKFKITKSLSEKIPFNFGTHPFSLVGDLYDRFSAPIEHRFSRKEIFDLLGRNGFSDIKIDRLKSRAGWVAWGYKHKCYRMNI